MFDLFGRRQTRNPVLQGEFNSRLYDELNRSAQLAARTPANTTTDALMIALTHGLAGLGDMTETRDREKYYTRQQDAEKRRLGALSETLMGLTGGAATSPAMASPAALGDALLANPNSRSPSGPSAPSAAPRGAVGISYEPGSPILPSQPPRSYAEAVGMSESGGQMIPNGTGSSAFGTYQFLPSTWQGLAERYPDQLRPDGISDPAQQEIAMRLFTDENRAALRRSLGREPTDAELYAAHALGAGGASTFLQAYAANPDTPMADVVAQIAGPNAGAWMAQNPQFGNGQTVGGMMHMYERPFAGSTGYTDPYAGSVTPMTHATPPASTMPAQSGGRPPMDPRLQALIPMLVANGQEDTAIALVSDYLMQPEQGAGFRVLSPQEEFAIFGFDAPGTFQQGPNGQISPVGGTVPETPPAPPTPSWTDIGGMRDDYTRATNQFAEVARSYAGITNALNEGSAAGDMAAVFSFMRILDPASTVRESEFASAQNAAGVPERIRNIYNNILRGELLSPSQRQDFYNVVTRQYGVDEQAYELARREWGRLAQAQGFDPSTVLYDRRVQIPQFTGGGGVVPTVDTRAAWGGFDPSTATVDDLEAFVDANADLIASDAALRAALTQRANELAGMGR